MSEFYARIKKKGLNSKLTSISSLYRFSWAFWHDHLSFVLTKDEWAQEMEWMIKTAEDKYNIKFTPGFNPNLQCIRLNLDPVLAVHRPLLFYLGIYLSTTLFNALALQWGWQFELYGDHGSVWGGVFYKLHQTFLWCTAFMQQRRRSKPMTTTTTTTTTATNEAANAPHTKRIVYWYRSVEDSCASDTTTNNNAKTPLVFIHGIGAGLMCYVEFIYRLVGLERPLFLVELPFVAMRMVDDVPDALAVVDDIKAMLHHHGYEHGVFVSHSLGTAVTSWMMTNAPSVVAGTILIDPICFMLHYPQVCFNFIHKIPKRIVDVSMSVCLPLKMIAAVYLNHRYSMTLVHHVLLCFQRALYQPLSLSTLPMVPMYLLC
jgi:pimeloyl-ACP methyl ester carboxylesterase